MKHFSTKLILALFAISTGLSAQATTWTVNNATAPVNPGEYSMISGAIAAASPGDTIIVAGSATPYDVSVSTLILNKQLVLIGPGYNPKGANPLPVKIWQPFQISCTASGSTIIGFEFDNSVSTISIGGTNHNNITFQRNYFNGSGTLNFGADSCVSIQFINNIFGANTGISSGGEPWYFVAFYNNIFLNGYIIDELPFGESTPLMTIDHNLFLNGSYSSPLLSSGAALFPATGLVMNDALVTNNIFYNAYPLALGWIPSSTISNNSYYNNITFGGSPIPDLIPNILGGTYLTNFASGNENNTNPMMNAIFSSPTYPYLDFNLDNVGLQAGSPCLLAGNDGTNIGPTGGLYPIYSTNPAYLTGEPAIPEVTQLNITGGTTVPIGTPITIQVKATKLN